MISRLFNKRSLVFLLTLVVASISLAVLPALVQSAPEAVLLKDINTTGASSEISQLHSSTGYVYFSLDDGTTGAELWKSDGTEGGTVMVKNIYEDEGGEDSSPYDFFDFDGEVYFVATDEHGEEIWKTDGTEEGTVMVKDINDSGGSSPRGFTVFNDEFYFSASDSTHGEELWKSDGTEEGTVMVKEFLEADTSSNPANFTVFDGEIYFSVYENGVSNNELWKTDGTEEGTVLVKDINEGPAPSDPGNLTVFNGALYFSASDGENGGELWKTDGTEEGTEMVKDISPSNSNPLSFTLFDDELYFVADNATNGTELWKTDGTEEGTEMVKDINEVNDGAGNAFANQISYEFVELNGFLFFPASSDGVGTELWKTDGTEVGTTMVKDVITEGEVPEIYNITLLGSSLYFWAIDENDPDRIYKLWKTDGTEEGTVVQDVVPGGFDDPILEIVTLNGLLYFVGKDSEHGDELWKSDGTEEGAEIIKDVTLGTLNSSSDEATQIFVVVGDEVFFAAYEGVHGYELWKTDGTEEGTELVKDIAAGSGSSEPTRLFAFNNEVYFAAGDEESGYELWKSDGTEEGTVMVKDINPEEEGSNPRNFTIFNNELYFSADDGIHSDDLWKTDGTEEGTELVKDINDGGDSDPAGFTIFNNELYFSAHSDAERELWKTDGTAEGTEMVKDINPDGGSNPTVLTVFNNGLYFIADADDEIDGSELWKSDGTEEGTVMVKNVNLAGTDELYVFDGNLYFSGRDEVNGTELWKSDGTEEGTEMLKNIYEDEASSGPRDFISFNNELYFAADDETYGLELWKTDGTEEGTVLIKDIIAGSDSSSPNNLIVFDGELYFSARDGVHGNELWKSDGTEEGTELFVDVNEGENSSRPTSPTVLGNKLIFYAGVPSTGFEPYYIGGTAEDSEEEEESEPAPTSRSGSSSGRGGGVAAVPLVTTPGLTNPVTGSNSSGAVAFLSSGISAGSTSSMQGLQRFLNTHGFPVTLSGPGSLFKESNVFGFATRDALVKFQKFYGVSNGSGVFDKETKNFIDNLLAGEKLAASSTPITLKTEPYLRDLKVGDQGNDVKSLQRFLIAEHSGSAAVALGKAGASGIFGPLTEAALIEYQKVKGIIPPSGYFGEKTRSLLSE